MNRTQVKAVNEDNVVETLKSARQSLIEFRDDVDKSADEIKNTKKSVEDLKSVDLRLEDDVNALAARLDEELEKILVFETEIARLRTEIDVVKENITTIINGINPINARVISLESQVFSLRHRLDVSEAGSSDNTSPLPDQAANSIRTVPLSVGEGTPPNDRGGHNNIRSLTGGVTVDLGAYISLKVIYDITIDGLVGNQTFTETIDLSFSQLDTFDPSKAISTYSSSSDTVVVFRVVASCIALSPGGGVYRSLFSNINYGGPASTATSGPSPGCNVRNTYRNANVDTIFIAPLSPSNPVDRMINGFRIWGRMAGRITLELIPQS